VFRSGIEIVNVLHILTALKTLMFIVCTGQWSLTRGLWQTTR